jgi:hypothetical protein
MEPALLQNAFINYKGVSISIATYVELMKQEKPQEPVVETNDIVMTIEELRDMFSRIYDKEVPTNKKNDADWIYSKINANDSTTNTPSD